MLQLSSLSTSYDIKQAFAPLPVSGQNTLRLPIIKKITYMCITLSYLIAPATP